MATPSQRPLRAMTPQQVRDLKRILKGLGLYHGRVDGRWDGRTVRAIRRFQERNGLTVTGAYDTATDQFLRDTFEQLNINSQPIKGADDATVKFIRENYGYLTLYLRHPELGPILLKAAEKKWDDLRLNAELQKTEWWKKTAPSARAWYQKKWEDPAAARRDRENQEANLRDQMFRLGINLRPHRLSKIVETSLEQQWSPEEIQDALVAESHWNGGRLPPGEIATDQMAVAQLRDEYLLPKARKGGKGDYLWARRIAAGELTVEDLRAHFADQAAKNYGHLTDQLGKGLSLKDLFDAHIQAIADELELDPDSVDLTDPKWSDILSFNDGGKVRSKTVGEARLMARQSPGFKTTAASRRGAGELATTLGQSFGMFG